MQIATIIWGAIGVALFLLSTVSAICSGLATMKMIDEMNLSLLADKKIPMLGSFNGLRAFVWYREICPNGRTNVRAGRWLLVWLLSTISFMLVFSWPLAR